MADFSRRSSRTSMRSKPLGQLLAENGDINSEQIAAAVKAQEEQGGMLGAILQRMGACTADAVGHALSKQVQVTDIQCEEISAAEDAIKLVPKDFSTREKLCPFERLGSLLCVVMGNPLNRKAISEIESMSRMKVKAFKAPWPKINELIERAYTPSVAPSVGKRSASGPQKTSPTLEDLSFELDDEPRAAAPSASKPPAKPGVKPLPVIKQNPAPKPAAAAHEPLPLDDDDIIIPPTEPDEQPAGPTGILEIPVDEIRLPSHAAIPMPKFAKAPVHGPIKGIESLDSGDAEIVDVVKRKTGVPGRVAPKPAPRVAKVNVDLENFDLSSATETVETRQGPESEAMEEIQHGGVEADESRIAANILVALKIVPDSYFYAGNTPKNVPRSDDLMDIIEALPVAEIVAESIADFERKNSAGAIPLATESGNLISMTGTTSAGKSRVELQRAPATPMAALRLGEGEFVKLTLQQVEDDLGEWEWNFASTGPIAVEPFEE